MRVIVSLVKRDHGLKAVVQGRGVKEGGEAKVAASAAVRAYTKRRFLTSSREVATNAGVVNVEKEMSVIMRQCLSVAAAIMVMAALSARVGEHRR